ncbi:MAG: cytochrome c [Candidatus Marinimicrobia bacterium]|nr:cytochrome c [Candidatus Neomarinimicrobiota bacterium]
MKQILKWGGGGLLVVILVFTIFVNLSHPKIFEAPYPDIHASTDSALIARGKYLAFGPAHCATCHVPMDKMEAVEDGLDMPLIGGWSLTIPPGTFNAPNLTPDPETGIGNYTDGELARALRYMVKKDGTLLPPFMAFQNLSDRDVQAIISFLRSQPAVKHEVPATSYSFIGKALVALGMLKPTGPSQPPPAHVPMDTSVAYGKYVARSVGNCHGCHTKLDLVTGKFIGEDFGGGFVMESDPHIPGLSFVTPNLTPHPTDGHIVNWDEETFVKRLKAGRIHKGSPMPWGANSKMTETELKAIYRYLQTLEPVAGKPERIVLREG